MDNPYVGLQAFDVDRATCFFGRSRESRELADLWRSNRLVVLYGPSGIGKTSLVRAGAVPRLRADRADLLPVGRAVPGSPLPAPALTGHNPYTFALLSSWSPSDSPVRLVGMTISEFLLARPVKKDQSQDDVPVYAVIDQFEEVLISTSVWQEHADAFMTELSRATKDLPQLRLLISIREDVVAALLPHEGTLAGHARARMRLTPLNPEQALAAVVGPVAGSWRSFAPDAAESLIRDLRTIRIRNALGEVRAVKTDAIEPWQLQVACAALWDRLPPERAEITVPDVHDFGDVGLALMDLYQRAIARLVADFRVPEDELRRWVEESFITEHGTRAQAYEGLDQTRGLPNQVPRMLEEHRVLRSELRSGARWFELQHDRLIEPIQQANRIWPGWADRDLTHAGRRRPNDYLRAAEAARAEGDLKRAAMYAQDCIRLAKQSTDGGVLRLRAEAESFLGDLAFHRDRLDEAERWYRGAAGLFVTIQAHTAVARLLAAIGRIYMKRHLPAQAAEQFQAALTRLSGDQSIKVDLARAHWEAGRLNDARGLFDSVLNADSENLDALAGRAEVLTDLGDYWNALDDLDRLLHGSGRTSTPELQAARALALIAAGRTAEADAEAVAARTAAPDSGPVLLRLAKAAELAGDLTLARDLARKAVNARNDLFDHQFGDARAILDGL
jgi:tetratricopeptide (TPR) repeat protein